MSQPEGVRTALRAALGICPDELDDIFIVARVRSKTDDGGYQLQVPTRGVNFNARTIDIQGHDLEDDVLVYIGHGNEHTPTILGMSPFSCNPSTVAIMSDGNPAPLGQGGDAGGTGSTAPALTSGNITSFQSSVTQNPTVQTNQQLAHQQAHTIAFNPDDHSDVLAVVPQPNQLLQFDGIQWSPRNVPVWHEVNLTTDGVTTIWTLPDTPQNGTEEVYLNGPLLFPDQYTLTGKTLTLLTWVPLAADRLTVGYWT